MTVLHLTYCTTVHLRVFTSITDPVNCSRGRGADATILRVPRGSIRHCSNAPCLVLLACFDESLLRGSRERAFKTNLCSLHELTIIHGFPLNPSQLHRAFEIKIYDIVSLLFSYKQKSADSMYINMYNIYNFLDLKVFQERTRFFRQSINTPIKIEFESLFFASP